MTRGDNQRPDPFWEEAEAVDLAALHGTTQYGTPHARGSHVHICPLCSGPVYSRDRRYCSGCGKSEIARQVRRLVAMARDQRLRKEREKEEGNA